MQIDKILVKDGRVHLEYSKRIMKNPEEFVTDSYTMTCSELARPEFYKALEGLRSYVCDICELPEDYEAGMKVNGVRITHDDDIFGVVISAVKTLKSSNTPLNIHTPWKSSVPEDGEQKRADGSSKRSLSVNCVKHLDTLMDLAEGYINGERAQASLPFEPKREKAAK